MPFFAFKQTHITATKLLDHARITGLSLRLGKSSTVHGTFLKPLAADTRIGGQQPHRHVVNVKARAHRLVQRAQAQADTLGTQ
ncbi:hypothetical protein D3C78_1851470 [compost metagenome]